MLQQTNKVTFQELLQFAADAHQPITVDTNFGQSCRIIPTALTFAGGVNSADHAQTFPALADLLRQQVSTTSGSIHENTCAFMQSCSFLRSRTPCLLLTCSLCSSQGCHVAILQPSHLTQGKGVSAAVNAVLQEFSGIQTDADDMLVRHSP